MATNTGELLCVIDSWLVNVESLVEVLSSQDTMAMHNPDSYMDMATGTDEQCFGELGEDITSAFKDVVAPKLEPSALHAVDDPTCGFYITTPGRMALAHTKRLADALHREFRHAHDASAGVIAHRANRLRGLFGVGFVDSVLANQS